MLRIDDLHLLCSFKNDYDYRAGFCQAASDDNPQSLRQVELRDLHAVAGVGKVC